jgi:hypothetical protein
LEITGTATCGKPSVSPARQTRLARMAKTTAQQNCLKHAEIIGMMDSTNYAGGLNVNFLYYSLKKVGANGPRQSH